MDDVTLQYLQSVIAIQLGVTAALPLQIRLTPQRGTRREGEHFPDVYRRLAFAVVIGATLFKSLAARSTARACRASRSLAGPSRFRPCSGGCHSSETREGPMNDTPSAAAVVRIHS